MDVRPASRMTVEKGRSRQTWTGMMATMPRVGSPSQEYHWPGPSQPATFSGQLVTPKVGWERQSHEQEDIGERGREQELAQAAVTPREHLRGLAGGRGKRGFGDGHRSGQRQAGKGPVVALLPARL